HYLARRAKTLHDIKLENIIPHESLVEWEFSERGKEAVKTGDSTKPREASIKNIRIFRPNPNQSNLNLFTRPGREFQSQFYNLYLMSQSPIPEDREKVETILEGMSYEPFDNSGLRAILKASLIVKNKEGSKDQLQAARSLINHVNTIYEQLSH